MPPYAFDPTSIRRLTPEGNALNKRVAALCGPLQRASPEQALQVLQVHLYGLVIASVAMAPDEPDRWCEWLRAALLAARDLGLEIRHDGGAAFLDAIPAFLDVLPPAPAGADDLEAER